MIASSALLASFCDGPIPSIVLDADLNVVSVPEVAAWPAALVDLVRINVRRTLDTGARRFQVLDGAPVWHIANVQDADARWWCVFPETGWEDDLAARS